ncbi:MAG: transporter substrate-binding domain-containing protein [Desulfobacterales bacterium]|nr:transporter substrate-binding domain-containing protein [Desulfobacterales bacterium]
MQTKGFRFILVLMFCVIGFHVIGAEAKTITLATVEWEPYYGPSLENDGFTVDLSRAAFQKAGYSLKIEYMPWKRAIVLGEQGKKYQGVFGAYYNDERNKIFVFSDTFASSGVGLFSRKGENISYKTLKDLAPYKVGVIKGYANTEAFDAADYIAKDETTDQVKNIKKLMNGRVDLIIGSPHVILYEVKSKLPEYGGKIELLNPLLKTNTLHFMISRKVSGHEKIIADFNRGLKMIKEDGTYDEIVKKHGF